jgi:hypothetical protein
VLAAVAAALVVPVPNAAAGTYTVRTCHGSTGLPAAVSDGSYGWQYEITPGFLPNGPEPINRCSLPSGTPNGGLEAQNLRSLPRPMGEGNGYVYLAAPDTEITAYRLWMYGNTRALGGSPPTDGAIIVWSGNAEAGHDFSIGFGGQGGSGGSWSLDDPPFADAPAVNVSKVHVRGICGGNTPPATCSTSTASYNAAFWIYRGQMTTRDVAAPQTSTPTGDATAHAVWHGPQHLDFGATDQGGGVYRMLLETGPDTNHLTTRSVSVVNPNDGRCTDENPANDDPYEFTYARPCPASVAASADLDTSALPEGDQAVRVRVEDAAGNRAVVYGPATKTIDNLAPAVTAVTVSGEVARVGDALSCAGTVDGQAPSLSVQWARTNADGSDAQDIPGATGMSYVPVAEDAGHKLVCRLTATDGGGATTATSSLTDGPFAGGTLVGGYCTGRPTGSGDACGDRDGDGVANHEDPDIDGDGTANAVDPDPYDPKVPAKSDSHGDGDGDGGDITQQSGGGGPIGSAHNDLNVVPVANPTAGAGLNGTPADEYGVVTAYFERGAGKTKHVSAAASADVGERLRIRGTLRTAKGKAITDAKVFLAEKTSGGTWKLNGGTISRKDGTLLLFTRKGGVTRQLRLVYFPRNGHDANRGSATLTLKVKQGATLSVSRTHLHNGQAVHFAGKVRGTVPANGSRVQMQVKLPAGWSTFASTRARRSAHGRYRVSYRFRRTTRRTTYRFRAHVVPGDSGAYVPGLSRTKKVVVVP